MKDEEEAMRDEPEATSEEQASSLHLSAFDSHPCSSSLIKEPSSLSGRRRRRVSLVGTSFEDEARARGFRLIAGVDEVGRVFLPATLRD